MTMWQFHLPTLIGVKLPVLLKNFDNNNLFLCLNYDILIYDNLGFFLNVIMSSLKEIWF